MKIIVGLGNPGKEYAQSRHNVGFMAVDLLRTELGFSDFKNDKKFLAEVCEGTIKHSIEGGTTEKILIAKPQTFMNLSGDSVQRLVQFYHANPSDVWIIYDDIDLPLGTYRIRSEGSAGTHNGMRDIIPKLGTQNFPRLRIGIESRGESSPQEQDLSSFVLHPFSSDELEIVKKTLDEAVQSLINGLTNDKNV